MDTIGNFRSAIAADILRRYLKFKGFKVTHVMNITDVEDRIIAKSQEAGLSIDDYTAKYIDALWEDFDALGCERPEIVPRATRHIPEMVSLIEKLLDTDHAYQSDGSIYYRIASFPEYGKLSKINFAAMGIEATRIEVFVEGDLDLRGTLGLARDVSAGFDAIRVRFEIDAPTATADQLASLQTKTERYCTVLQTLTRPPQLETEFCRA